MYEELVKLQSKDTRLAVGLMSGTSLDGVDAALVRLTGNGPGTRVELLHFGSYPYAVHERHRLLELCHAETGRVDEVCGMNTYLGERFAEAATKTVAAAGYQLTDIDFISSHGQTIHHMPQVASTLQIGELSVIASRTGCLTVGDFRPSDMALGGQGAPLVPYVDYLLFGHETETRGLLNIGGIANITVLPPGVRGTEVIAFDTGPGNVLIDAVVSIITDGRETFDKGGDKAMQGTVCHQLLGRWLSADLFVAEQPPKSTGREHYTAKLARQLYNEAKEEGLSHNDVVATVSHYTVESIARQCRFFSTPLTEVYVGGGGAHNTYLMQELQTSLNIPVRSMESLRIPADAKEALAFAVLGNELLSGNTNSLPSVTGATRPARMGKIALP